MQEFVAQMRNQLNTGQVTRFYYDIAGPRYHIFCFIRLFRLFISSCLAGLLMDIYCVAVNMHPIQSLSPCISSHDSPLLILPVSSSSNVSVLAYLGVIAITNEFIEFKAPKVNVCNSVRVAFDPRNVRRVQFS